MQRNSFQTGICQPFRPDSLRVALLRPAIRHVDAHTFVSDSELRGLWEEGIIQRSKFFVSHFSDVMRFLLLHKFGGTYLDMDQIVLKSLPDLPNFLGRESIWIGKKTHNYLERDIRLIYCPCLTFATVNLQPPGSCVFNTDTLFWPNSSVRCL